MQFSYILFISSNYYYAHDFRSEWYFFFVANAIFLAATFLKAIYRQRYCHQTHSPRCPSCSLHRKIPAYEYNCKFCPRKLNRSYPAGQSQCEGWIVYGLFGRAGAPPKTVPAPTTFAVFSWLVSQPASSIIFSY